MGGINIASDICHANKLLEEYAKANHKAHHPLIPGLSILKIPGIYRSLAHLNHSRKYIETLKKFIDFVNIKDESILTSFLEEFSRSGSHLHLNKGQVLIKSGQINNYFYLLLSGKLGELSVKYDKLCLKREDYLIHGVKLMKLNELTLLAECLSLNNSLIPIGNSGTHYLKTHEQKRMQYFYDKAEYELNHSKWSVTKRLADYMEGTGILVNEDGKRFERAQKIVVTIPSYFHLTTLNKGSYIGSLAPTKNVKLISTYFSLDNTEIMYLNKDETKNDKVYDVFYSEIQKEICKIYRSFYIFQHIPENIFGEKYAKYFSYKVVKKGDFIIRQSAHSEGIFLIKSGEFKLTTTKAFNEMNALISDLKLSGENFSNYINGIKIKGEEFTYDNGLLNPLFRTKEFIALSSEKKQLFITNITNKQILGLNEFYNYKLEINHFEVICTSAVGELFFLPKESYNIMISQDNTIMKKCVNGIEEKVKYYIENIKRHKQAFGEDTSKNLQTSMKNLSKDEHYYKELNHLYKDELQKMIGRTCKNTNIMSVSKNSTKTSSQYTILNNSGNSNNKYKQLKLDNSKLNNIFLPKVKVVKRSTSVDAILVTEIKQKFGMKSKNGNPLKIVKL